MEASFFQNYNDEQKCKNNTFWARVEQLVGCQWFAKCIVNAGSAGEEALRTALAKIVALKRTQKRERKGKQSEGDGRARKVHKT